MKQKNSDQRKSEYSRKMRKGEYAQMMAQSQRLVKIDDRMLFENSIHNQILKNNLIAGEPLYNDKPLD